MSPLTTPLLRLQPSHGAVLEAFHAACFAPGARWSAASFATLLALPGYVGLLNPAAGFVLGRVAADEAELLTLAVLPDRRREGIGRALLRGWLRIAVAQGATTLFLEVEDGNASALALYVAEGLCQTGRRRAYYPSGADALLYACPINIAP